MNPDPSDWGISRSYKNLREQRKLPVVVGMDIVSGENIPTDKDGTGKLPPVHAATGVKNAHVHRRLRRVVRHASAWRPSCSPFCCSWVRSRC